MSKKKMNVPKKSKDKEVKSMLDTEYHYIVNGTATICIIDLLRSGYKVKKFKSVAKCLPEEESKFVEGTGKVIAKLKAEKKLLAWIIDEIVYRESIMRAALKCVDELSNLATKVRKNRRIDEEKIAEVQPATVTTEPDKEEVPVEAKLTFPVETKITITYPIDGDATAPQSPDDREEKTSVKADVVPAETENIPIPTK